jgi:hypothetical protein
MRQRAPDWIADFRRIGERGVGAARLLADLARRGLDPAAVPAAAALIATIDAEAIDHAERRRDRARAAAYARWGRAA